MKHVRGRIRLSRIAINPMDAVMARGTTMRNLNVGIVGYKFMGRAHSNAWKKAPLFFDLNVAPVLKVACGRHAESLKAFAGRWGWEQTESDWKKMVRRDDVDIVDISAPQYLHY